ncbi:hypothetical protein [Streptomyces asiaticus]
MPLLYIALSAALVGAAFDAWDDRRPLLAGLCLGLALALTLHTGWRPL